MQRNPLRLLVLSQIGSKLTGVFLNLLLLRTAGPKIFAVSARLDLVTSTILSVCRETMRMALLRYSPHTGAASVSSWKHSLFRMSTNAAMIGMMFGLGCIPVFTRLVVGDELRGIGTSYLKSVRQYCMAAAMEMACEPFVVYFMHLGRIDVRSYGDTGLALLRACLLYLCLDQIAMSEDLLSHTTALLGNAQLYGALVLCAYYLVLFMWNERKLPISERLSLRGLWSLDGSMRGKSDVTDIVSIYKQSVLRFVMAQADSIVTSWLSPLSLQEQGVFALASNYISLFPRIIQAPLEENGYLLFTKHIDKSPERDQRNAYLYFGSVVKFDILIGYILILFGMQYSGSAALLVLTKVPNRAIIHTSLRNVLAAACILVPIMSISGISEAFMNATAGPLGMHRIRNVNIVFSASHILACLVLARWFGAVGLIAAAIGNFSSRAVVSFGYAAIRPNPYKRFDIFPKKATMKLLAALSASCMVSGKVFGYGSSKHIICGIGSGLIAIIQIARREHDVVRLFATNADK